MEWIDASCACGAIQLRVQVAVERGTLRCNCRGCTKRGWWTVRVELDDLEVVAGEADLVVGDDNPYFVSRRCRHCAVQMFGTVAAPEGGGPCAKVNVRVLDGVDLEGVPVTWLDGLNDTWAPLGTTQHRPARPPAA